MNIPPVNGSSPADVLYQQAVQQQLAGHVEEAQRLYQQLLQAVPQHAAANHNLGLLLYARGDTENALPLLMNAVEQQSQQQQFWISLCEVLLAAGAVEHVIDALHQAHEAGVPVCDEFLQLERRAAALLGPAQIGDLVRSGVNVPLDEAVEIIISGRQQMTSLKQILHVRKGKHATNEIRKNANILLNTRQDTALLQEGERLIKKYPDDTIGWLAAGLGRLLLKQDMQQGIHLLLHANDISPDNPQLLQFLGFGLLQLGESGLARRTLERCLELQPGNQAALNNLSVIFVHSMAFFQAEALCKRLLELNKNDARAYSTLAIVYGETKRFEQAEAAYEQSLSLVPDATVFGNYSLMMYQMGNLNRCLELGRRGLQLFPDKASAYSNYIFFMSHDETVSPQTLYKAHLEFARQFEQPLLAQQQEYTNSREPERKLRIGFVSGDFLKHAVMQFVGPVLTQLDRNQFDLYAFSTRISEDEVQKRVKPLFRLWMDVPAVSERDLAELIRATKIDILIDLSGHTGYNRLLTFAYKPAPVQMTWVGYPYTTGMKSMDYFLTDFYTTPEGKFDQLYTEKLVRLPSNYEFLELKTDVPVNELPALQNGYLTFASFNRHSKISETTLDIWAQVLLAVPDARMLIAATPSDEAEKKIRSALTQRGVAAERLRFSRVVNYDAYLKMHHEVDLLLDTYPYNGGTTTNHALGMGVPMLALSSQDMLVSNLGAGVSTNFGLGAFVSHSSEQLQENARYWADHLPELAAVRTGLRQQIHERIEQLHTTKGIEAALRHMWRRWCQGLPAQTFRLTTEDF